MSKKKTQAKPKANDKDLVLLGHDKLEAQTELANGIKIAADHVVLYAQLGNALSVDDWNALSDELRWEKISAALETLDVLANNADNEAAFRAEFVAAINAATPDETPATKPDVKGFAVLDTIRSGGEYFYPGDTLPTDAVTKKVAAQMRKNGLIK